MTALRLTLLCTLLAVAAVICDVPTINTLALQSGLSLTNVAVYDPVTNSAFIVHKSSTSTVFLRLNYSLKVNTYQLSSDNILDLIPINDKIVSVINDISSNSTKIVLNTIGESKTKFSDDLIRMGQVVVKSGLSSFVSVCVDSDAQKGTVLLDGHFVVRVDLVQFTVINTVDLGFPSGNGAMIDIGESVLAINYGQSMIF
jgi:hypothetical protein